jgi:hypothetical protein
MLGFFGIVPAPELRQFIQKRMQRCGLHFARIVSWHRLDTVGLDLVVNGHGAH